MGVFITSMCSSEGHETVDKHSLHPCHSNHEIQMAFPGTSWLQDFLPCLLVGAHEPLFPERSSLK